MFFSQITDFCDENVFRIYDKDCMGFISTGISAHSVECLDEKHSTNNITVRLALRGGGVSVPSVLTVNSCENFNPLQIH